MPRAVALPSGNQLQPLFERLPSTVTIGIDLGDRYSHCCILDASGDVIAEGRVRTTPHDFADHFKSLAPALIAIEVGSHSRWISRKLLEWGHQVVVANPRNLPMITANIRKSDRVDAHMLARLVRVDQRLLSPVTHTPKEDYPAVAQLRARDLLVKSRTRLINAVRGISKAAGLRIPSSSSGAFVAKAIECLSEELRPSLDPLIETIAHLSKQIKALDLVIENLGREKYPVTAQLRQVAGVGPVTSLEYILTIGNPKRFARSRDVGAYLGLTPRRGQSGETDPQLRISKAGNKRLRFLLVQCAQFVLGRFGPESDLKNWGLTLALRGGANAKKRAITAVARKLAALLHHLWTTGDVYQPLFKATIAA